MRYLDPLGKKTFQEFQQKTGGLSLAEAADSGLPLGWEKLDGSAECPHLATTADEVHPV